MKRIVLIVLIVLAAISLYGCGPLLPYGSKHEIFSRAGTDWISEDETMSIHVNDDGMATMVMEVDGKEYELSLGGRYSMIIGYYLDEPIGGKLEEWNAFYHRKWFRIKVDSSRFFEKGTKIRFYKVEE